MPLAMSVTEARAGLPDVLDRVEAGEEITITRHGHAVAVVVRPDVLRRRRADEALALADSIRGVVEMARRELIEPEGVIGAERAEELVAEIRAGRDRR